MSTSINGVYIPKYSVIEDVSNHRAKFSAITSKDNLRLKYILNDKVKVIAPDIKSNNFDEKKKKEPVIEISSLNLGKHDNKMLEFKHKIRDLKYKRKIKNVNMIT